MQLIKDFFKDRTVKFYIALGTAGLSVITAIVYAATLGHLSEYMSWIPFVLLLVGAVVFLAGALLRQTRLGAAAMAVLDFIAFLTYVGTIYAWPISQSMVVSSIDDIAEMPAIIVCAALMLICIIAANVCAWMRLQKKQDAEASAAD